jgi:hypothetical protein
MGDLEEEPVEHHMIYKYSQQGGPQIFGNLALEK